MGFVKAVTSKFFDQVENPSRGCRSNTTFAGTADKDLALLRHLLRIFLTHCTTQKISSTQGVSREHSRNLHNLFLVQNDSVSLCQHRLQVRMKIINVHLVGIVPTQNKVVNHARLQRTRTKKSDQRDQIIELIWLDTLDQIAHTARLQLKYGSCITALQELKSKLVLHRNIFNIERIVRTNFVNGLYGPINDRQCP